MSSGLKGLKCVCSEGIYEPGGIIFIPKRGQKGLESKLHVCISCAKKVADLLGTNKEVKGAVAATYKSPPLETKESGEMIIVSMELSRHYLRKIKHLLKNRLEQ